VRTSGVHDNGTRPGWRTFDTESLGGDAESGGTQHYRAKCGGKGGNENQTNPLEPAFSEERETRRTRIDQKMKPPLESRNFLWVQVTKKLLQIRPDGGKGKKRWGIPSGHKKRIMD